MNRSQRSDWWIAGLFLAVIASGFVCAFMSFLLSGAGHGWYAPLYVSWIAIVAGPLSLAVLDSRNSPFGITTSVVLVIAAVILDGWLIVNSGGSEINTDSFRHVFAMGPDWVALWLFTWLLWQAIALYVLGARVFARQNRPMA